MKKIFRIVIIMMFAIGLSGCKQGEVKNVKPKTFEKIIKFTKGVDQKVIVQNNIGQINIKGKVSGEYNNIGVMVEGRLHAVVPIMKDRTFVYQSEGYNTTKNIDFFAAKNLELSDEVNLSSLKGKIRYRLQYVRLNNKKIVQNDQQGAILSLGNRENTAGQQAALLGQSIQYSNGLKVTVTSVDNQAQGDTKHTHQIRVNLVVDNMGNQEYVLSDIAISVKDAQKQNAKQDNYLTKIPGVGPKQTVNAYAVFHVDGDKPYVISIGGGHWLDQ